MRSCRLDTPGAWNKSPDNDLSRPGAHLHSFHYRKVISAIMSAAVLAGLQGVMTTMPASAETSCHLEKQNEGASTEKCQAQASDKAALRAAHAQVGEAPEKQRPAAAHCVAARGLPSRPGAWQLGIDRATGHKCWRLVGVVKPPARLVAGANPPPVPKPSPVSKPSAVSPASTPPRPNPVAAAAAVQAYGQSQPAEVLTGSIAKSSAPLHIDLGRSPIPPEAGGTGTTDQVERDELQPFDRRFAWTTGQSLIETIAAVVAGYSEAAELSAGNILDHASALISAHGRPAIFLMVFLSVLATIVALYALIVGSFRFLRSPGFRGNASAIRVTPQRYLQHMPGPPGPGFPDEQV